MDDPEADPEAQTVVGGFFKGGPSSSNAGDLEIQEDHQDPTPGQALVGQGQDETGEASAFPEDFFESISGTFNKGGQVRAQKFIRLILSVDGNNVKERSERAAKLLMLKSEMKQIEAMWQQDTSDAGNQPPLTLATVLKSKKLGGILLCFVLIFAYLLLTALVYLLFYDELMNHSRGEWADIFYFRAASVYTVGYGDVAPTTKSKHGVRIVTCILLCLDFVVVGYLATILPFKLLEDALYMWRGILDADGKRKLERWVVRSKIMAFGLLCLLFAVGVVLASYFERIDLIESIYLIITTLTTVGFGDISFKSLGGRIFATVWLWISCPICQLVCGCALKLVDKHVTPKILHIMG